MEIDFNLYLQCVTCVELQCFEYYKLHVPQSGGRGSINVVSLTTISTSFIALVQLVQNSDVYF